MDVYLLHDPVGVMLNLKGTVSSKIYLSEKFDAESDGLKKNDEVEASGRDTIPIKLRNECM